MMRLLVAFSIFISPLLSVAQMTDFTRQELSYVNVLAPFNGGFESGTAKWTASGGTFASVTSGSNLLEGKGSTTWNSNGAAQTLTSQAVTVKNGYFGRNCEASIVAQVPSGTATHTFQAWDGTNPLAFATIESSTLPRKNTLTFPCPSSGTFALRLLSVNADEPLIAVDEGYLGLARNVGVADFIGPVQSYTPTLLSSGGGAITLNATSQVAINGKKWRVGEGIAISVSFRNGSGGAASGAAGTVLVSVPSECTPDTTKMVTSVAGVQKLGDSVTGSTGAGTGGTIYFASGQNIAILPHGGTTLAVSDLIASYFVNFNAIIPCVGWAASTTVMPDAQGLSWSGLYAGDCTWTTTSATFASPSADASCTFAERTNRNFGTVSSEGSKLPGIVFTPRVTGTYFVCATVHGYNSAASGYVAFSLRNSTTSTNISTAGRRQGSSGGLNDEQPMTMCGLTVISSAASTTITILMLASSGTSTLVSNSSANAIEWTIFNADQPTQAILANSVSSANTNGTYFNSAQVGSTGTITKETGDWISGSCVVASAVATCTLVAGAFSTDPACHATIFGETTSYNAVVTSASTSTVVVRTFDTANAAAAAAFNLTCSSPR